MQNQQQQQDPTHQNNSMTHLNEPLDQLNAMEKSLNDQVNSGKTLLHNTFNIKLLFKSIIF